MPIAPHPCQIFPLRATPAGGWLPRRLVALAAVVLGACSPALNWRDVKPADADGLTGAFPCKPDHRQRQVRLSGLPEPVTVHLASCEADGAMWALSHVRLADVMHVAPALRALAVTQRENLQAVHDQAVGRGRPVGDRAGSGADVAASVSAEDLGPIDVPGMTPNPDARGWRLRGMRLGSGGAAPENLTVTSWHFSHGLVVFQASVWRVDAQHDATTRQEASDVFLRGFHFPG